jgi:hypothetical protein
MLTTLDDIIAAWHAATRPDSPRRSPAYEALLLVTERIRTRYRTPADFTNLNAAEQLVFRVFVTLDGEVRNGGIDQYLRNASGDDGQQVISDLTTIGAHETEAVLIEAAQWFDHGVIPSDGDKRFDQLIAAEERNPEEFERKETELSRWYATSEPELYEKLMRFVELHQAEFLAF